MESQWDYQEDDSGNEIYTVLIDTMVKDKLELYIVFASCLIKKFTAPLVASYHDLQFEEYPHILSVESLFKGKAKENNAGGDKTRGAASKKTNLYEQFKGDLFIANSVFYS